MSERNNSFDIIRHVAAYMVLFSHHFRLSGDHEPVFLQWDSYGAVAVAIFFCLSGFLMPKSFNSSGSFIEFMRKRCLRIFPALFVCSVVMYLFVAVEFNSNNSYAYLFSSQPYLNIIRNTVFLQSYVDGVFSDYFYPHVINGSLWTLPIEFSCYLIIGLALSISFTWVGPALLLVTCILSTIIFNFYPENYTYFSVPFKSLSLFGMPFFFGALLSMTTESWLKYKKQVFITASLLLIAVTGKPEIQIVAPLCLSVIVIVLGLTIKDRVINGRIDISYGLYIYAFPVQQIIINNITNKFIPSIALSLFVTTLLATVSYYYIEKPFLRRKRKEIIVSEG
ncbi:TPA: acyltransferase family protein [Escherichia coli]|uniref:acyltransferase family protein n=1 Tax=Escherichia coli TaxID=562 RepID=UPI0010AC953E|nr:acyltransferase [Escherichia coli]EET0018722.1 acyltransferase [Escherichia coli]EET5524896.1 acyltransferase [Escherichia coli]EEU0348128.1 acyltransferase [Escherichia coli]EEV0323676.1 acyltransferase [Escherichia coli]EEV4001473.1 acyltransferase [Escherichia coli]